MRSLDDAMKLNVEGVPCHYCGKPCYVFYATSLFKGEVTCSNDECKDSFDRDNNIRIDTNAPKLWSSIQTKQFVEQSFA